MRLSILRDYYQCHASIFRIFKFLDFLISNACKIIETTSQSLCEYGRQ